MGEPRNEECTGQNDGEGGLKRRKGGGRRSGEWAECHRDHLFPVSLGTDMCSSSVTWEYVTFTQVPVLAVRTVGSGVYKTATVLIRCFHEVVPSGVFPMCLRRDKKQERE